MNTIGTGTYGTPWRAKYFSKKMQRVLRKALVCEKVCDVDNSDNYYIHNPYTAQHTAAIASIAGTYSISAWSTTDDTLTVNKQVTYAVHIYDFEQIMTSYDMMATRIDEMIYAVAWGIDYYVLNNLCEDSTTTYTAPAGGFTESSNIPVICSNLVSKVAGYADMYKGLFLVIENTDVPGFLQAQVASGFSYADAALNNGFMGNYMGIDIYVVRSSTFVSATIGGVAVTNDNHRVFGVKGVATYASPRGIQYEEKAVSGKTGREVECHAYVGFKFWTQKAALGVDIDVSA